MRDYVIELEIFEGNGGEPRPDGTLPDFAREGICAWMHGGDGEPSLQVGQKFRYPEDLGKLCPWLVDSINSVIRVLKFGGTLPWLYENTPYEKTINPEGVTTEYIRCVDPTDSGIVVKITSTVISS